MSEETKNDTKRYRLVVGQHLSGGRLYKTGDKINLTEDQVERIGQERLEIIHVADNTTTTAKSKSAETEKAEVTKPRREKEDSR